MAISLDRVVEYVRLKPGLTTTQLARGLKIPITAVVSLIQVDLMGQNPMFQSSGQGNRATFTLRQDGQPS